MKGGNEVKSLKSADICHKREAGCSTMVVCTAGGRVTRVRFPASRPDGRNKYAHCCAFVRNRKAEASRAKSDDRRMSRESRARAGST